MKTQLRITKISEDRDLQRNTDRISQTSIVKRPTQSAKLAFIILHADMTPVSSKCAYVFDRCCLSLFSGFILMFGSKIGFLALGILSDCPWDCAYRLMGLLLFGQGMRD